ncbi:hypothetical protein JXJ21_07410 [candidate division KSB1 bacterium]|nr:hypothetical protein [candidate division KSB1 bacterium]
MINKLKKYCYFHYIALAILIFNESHAQPTGSIWIKQFLPGSASISDQTINQQTLAFVDSLMQRENLDVVFLGGADSTNWHLFGKKIKKQVSDTWDQAKKLQRASALRQRYNKGQIGTTNEPIRGVKVVWRLKEPDVFLMDKRLQYAEAQLNSLSRQLDSLKSNPLSASENVSFTEEASGGNSVIEHPMMSDWEMTGGVMVWSAGSPYDLSVPYVGLAFKRSNWAIEFQGGFTPWSRQQAGGERGDALLLGSIHFLPKPWLRLKAGFFSGWEFLSDSDVWTMKIMGLTIGPKVRWKMFETYLGYSIGKLSSLTEEHWCSGCFMTTSLQLNIF